MEIGMYTDNDGVIPEKERFRLVRIRPNMELRAKILWSVRSTFRGKGFLEVETPSLIPAPAPEENIETLATEDGYLAASPELQMKRLLMAGYERIFQICHCFRKGEFSPRHQQEFLMCEWYRVGEGIDALMADCESLVRDACREIGLPSQIRLEGEWERIEIRSIYRRLAGWDPCVTEDPRRFDRDMVGIIEPSLPLDRPVFLVGYPSYQASLAQMRPGEPPIAERFELYIRGIELANGFHELTDSREQRTRFVRESDVRREKGMHEYPFDEFFLKGLEQGMPDSSGIALGLDRLVMVLVGATALDNVLFFPRNRL